MKSKWILKLSVASILCISQTSVFSAPIDALLSNGLGAVSPTCHFTISGGPQPIQGASIHAFTDATCGGTDLGFAFFGPKDGVSSSFTNGGWYINNNILANQMACDGFLSTPQSIQIRVQYAGTGGGGNTTSLCMQAQCSSSPTQQYTCTTSGTLVLPNS